MPYSPKAITALYPLLEKAFSSAERSGVFADKPGYHNSRNELIRDGRRGDYSIQLGIDKEGDGNASSGFDVKLNREHLRVVTQRMMTAAKNDDPRLKGKIREFFGSYDGNGVDGWSLLHDRFATSDSSHEWHLHISGYRKYNTDEKVWLGIAEVLLGHPAGALTGGSAPALTTPGKPVPATCIIYHDRVKPGVQDSDSVWWVQRWLNNVPMPAAPSLTLTGDYGPGTTKVAAMFQEDLLDDEGTGDLTGKQTEALYRLARKANPDLPTAEFFAKS